MKHLLRQGQDGHFIREGDVWEVDSRACHGMSTIFKVDETERNMVIASNNEHHGSFSCEHLIKLVGPSDRIETGNKYVYDGNAGNVYREWGGEERFAHLNVICNTTNERRYKNKYPHAQFWRQVFSGLSIDQARLLLIRCEGDMMTLLKCVHKLRRDHDIIGNNPERIYIPTD